MRAFVALWLAPGTLFWGWHLLSVHDVFFRREAHDQIFLLYGFVLDVEPAMIPSLFVRAFALDGAFLLAVIALRRRKPIGAFVQRWGRAVIRRAVSDDPARPAG